MSRPSLRNYARTQRTIDLSDALSTDEIAAMSDRMNKIYRDLAKQERTKSLVRKRPTIGESIPHEGTGFGAVISS